MGISASMTQIYLSELGAETRSLTPSIYSGSGYGGARGRIFA
jgi:hypothetical protein